VKGDCLKEFDFTFFVLILNVYILFIFFSNFEAALYLLLTGGAYERWRDM
jgi:hypothetical protein